MVKRTAGVTLVELIIVLAIMSIVIVAGFQVHAFSQRTTSRGLNEAQIQTQQRMVADFVLRELRYVGDVSILTDMPVAASIDPNTRYIFIHSSGVPHIMENSVARAIPGVETANTSTMQFTPIDNQTVGFRIETENKGQIHMLESSVALLNETGLAETPSSGSVIAYRDAQYTLFRSVEVEGTSGGGSGGTGGTGGGESSVSLISITGIKPVIDEYALLTPPGSFEGFTATIGWDPNPASNSGKFKKDNDYDATIIITPKTGYTLSGLTTDKISVSGATITYSYNPTTKKGTIEADFPALPK